MQNKKIGQQIFKLIMNISILNQRRNILNNKNIKNFQINKYILFITLQAKEKEYKKMQDQRMP